MIYLNAEIFSGLGDDTFWCWFEREFPGVTNRGIIGPKTNKDAILQYSTMGEIEENDAVSIALLWELLPEMKVVFNSNEWDHKINATNQAAGTCKYRVVPTKFSIPYYSQYGNIDILPIGIDTDLFKPAENKQEIRKKYNLPLDKEIGFWGGTRHPMKGFDNLQIYAKGNPNVHWVIVWKTPNEKGNADHLNCNQFTLVNQTTLTELMSCCDFILCCGMLRPFYMIEWEAMACNLKVINITGFDKDFSPSRNPRDDIFKLGWDRKTVKKTWEKYLTDRGVKLWKD